MSLCDDDVASQMFQTDADGSVVYSLSIVRLAVNAVVPDETRWLSVQGKLTHTAPQAMGMPGPSVHLQQVLVCDWFRARSAQLVLRLRTTQCKVRALSYCLHRINIQSADILNVSSDKGMFRSDISKLTLTFFSLQEYTQQNPLSKF
jgi:hypothetical protein